MNFIKLQKSLLLKCFIATLFFLQVACGGSSSSSSSSGACGSRGLPGSLSTDIQSYMTTNSIVGMTVYLHHPDHGEYAEAFGFSRKDTALPATVNTRFSSASFGKAVTVAAALKLVEKSRISLDDNVSVYYPSLVDTGSGPIKVYQLMNHTSLVDDSFTGRLSDLQSNPLQTVDYVDHIVEALGMGYLAGTIGSTYSYSSANTNLLGYVMAQSESKDWQQVVQDEVLTPYSLENIFFHEYSTDTADTARSYPDVGTDPAQAEIAYSPALMKYGGAGGTLYGTGCGFGRFAKQFFSGDMHSAAIAAEHASRRIEYVPASSHFAQLGNFKFDGEALSQYDIIYHQGGGPGFSTYGAYVKTLGWTYFFAMNVTNPGSYVDDVSTTIGTALVGL